MMRSSVERVNELGEVTESIPLLRFAGYCPRNKIQQIAPGNLSVMYSIVVQPSLTKYLDFAVHPLLYRLANEYVKIPIPPVVVVQQVQEPSGVVARAGSSCRIFIFSDHATFRHGTRRMCHRPASFLCRFQSHISSWPPY